MDTIGHRRAILRCDLDIATLRGLEFGPLNAPTVSKAEGDILYIDHVTTDDLRHKYRDDASVDLATICDVDLVYESNALAGQLQAGSIDYVVASHVAEHVPDLTSWLRDIQNLLKPDGELRLVLPDKRFSFDYLRRESSAAELLDAYLHQLRKPRTLQILDCALDVANVDARGVYAGMLMEADITRVHTYDSALAIARDVFDTGKYLDVHCWVFTPESFARNMEVLAATGLIDMGFSRFVDTESDYGEFFVFLTPFTDRQKGIESWQEMRRQAAVGLRPVPPGAGNSGAGLIEQNAELVARNTALEHVLAAMRTSSSWRITAPMRAVGRLLMSRQRRPARQA
jgi:predicted SAM-dependent methyltransferase